MTLKNITILLTAIVCLQGEAAVLRLDQYISFFPENMSPPFDCAGATRSAFADEHYAPVEKDDGEPRLDKPDLLGMARLSRYLHEVMAPYREELRGAVLEVGPYFHPISAPNPGNYFDEIFYWDMDLRALNHLSQDAKYYPVPAHPMYIDLDRASPEYRTAFLNWNWELLRRRNHSSFKTIIVSQVLNYVDYRATLATLAGFQKKGDLLFINNKIKEGLFWHFNNDRGPKHWRNIEQAVLELGYEIYEPTFIPNTTEHDRVIFAARKL